MEQEGVVGTAVGLDDGGKHTVFILLERPDAPDIPTELEGVPVRPIVTGTIYALSRSAAPTVWTSFLARDRTPPAIPSGLTATPISSSEIKLAWTANSLTIDPDFSYYNVYRSAFSSNGPYSRRASNVKTNAYLDTGLPPSMTYWYQVTAVDKSGNESAKSTEAHATTLTGTMPTLWCSRPVPIGVSTGHPNITAGTIGCRVVDTAGNVYALSNNHVYADQNRASIGDNVLQPGVYDGGINPRDAIGKLAAFVPISFSRGANNTIDAAIASVNKITVGGEQVWAVGVATPSSDGYGTPSATIVKSGDIPLQLAVQKYGRGSSPSLTKGNVTAVNATVNVQYDRGVARFVGQILVGPGGFSTGGDSGSLIVTQIGNNPVGLLFAGSSSVTVANPIDAVLTQFHVIIDGSN